MKTWQKLVGDLRGIASVLGMGAAIRWMIAIGIHFQEVLASRNLQSADRVMGEGPFNVNMERCGVDFRIMGAQAFSGIREMYVRDTYLHNGLLSIEDGDVIVDLGANMGNFTILALAHGPNVRVIAVEPNKELNSSFWRSVSLNAGFEDRVTLIRSFLGVRNTEKMPVSGPQYEGALCMSDTQFMAAAAIDRVDFLKCDIEGGEFDLLQPGSELLRITRKVAVEVHSFAGDVDAFIRSLIVQGLEIKHIRRDPDGTATVLAARD